MKAFITGFFLCLCLTAYANDAEKFIGAWRYVQSVSSDGLIDTSLGEHPLGYIIYTAEGIMSVQIMNPNRKSITGNKPTPNESQKNAEDFFAYSGHYEINEKTHIVTHHLEMAILPNMVGKNYQRLYRFDGQYLYLTVIDSKKEETLKWAKIEK